jgi:hypothetical protein
MWTKNIIRTLRSTVLSSMSSLSGAFLQGLDFVDGGVGLGFCHHRQYK